MLLLKNCLLSGKLRNCSNNKVAEYSKELKEVVERHTIFLCMLTTLSHNLESLPTQETAAAIVQIVLKSITKRLTQECLNSPPIAGTSSKKPPSPDLLEDKKLTLKTILKPAMSELQSRLKQEQPDNRVREIKRYIKGEHKKLRNLNPSAECPVPNLKISFPEYLSPLLL